MANELLAVLRTQLHLVWSLLSLSLEPLTDDECHWSPALDDRTATVRRDKTGAWIADWSGLEEEPYPVTTIAWLTWHIGWWWTTAITHATHARVPDRTEITWPGTAEATRAWIRHLHDEWLQVLDGLAEDDLGTLATFPWPQRPDRTVADMVAWVNAELMKNAAEIGDMRILHTALA